METPMLTAEQQKTLNCLLVEAVEKNDIERARICIAKGADVHTEKDGQPLFHIAYHGSETMCDFLLSQGINTDIPDKYGMSGLARSVECGRLLWVRYALKKGADPLTVSKGISALERARLSTYEDRQQVLDAMLASLPDQPRAERDVREDFTTVATTRTIKAAKQIVLSPHKQREGGFKL